MRAGGGHRAPRRLDQRPGSRSPRGAPRPPARARPPPPAPPRPRRGWARGPRAGSGGTARRPRPRAPRAGRRGRASARRSPARCEAHAGEAGTRMPSPPPAIPRRRARCRSPPRRACGCGGRARAARAPSPACRSSKDRLEVERSIERSGPQREVALADPRDETVVEGLGDAQGRVNAVPAEADRQLVDPQLARMEEAEQLDALEARLAQRTELLRPVLADMPRVVRLLGARRRERQDVGSGDIRGAARTQELAEAV